MIKLNEILERIKSYDPNVNTDLITKAFNLAKEKHALQIRASGEPYFVHPLAVAEILIDMKMDQSTVCTGLLHDVVEDTDVTLDIIKQEFGAVIAKLVDGVTKLNRISFKSVTEKQAENFRKFIIAIASDIRVLIIKLADRLHNMRTIQFIASEEKKRRIATETLEIYSPLAERIGMQNLLEELQDICFKVLYKNERSSIKQKLQTLNSKVSLIEEIIKSLHIVLSRSGIDAEICGRKKTPFSIWRKMHKYNVSFDQLTDIMAFRVLVKNVPECYNALGAIHTNFQALPNKFRDYISTPKLNNYQSLHTSIFGPFNQKIEVQIKTPEMHEIAETGIAAHWSYKENITSNVDPHFSQYKWIRNLLTVIDKNSLPAEVLGNTKLEMFDNEVFCFTPQGEIISLPMGATCLDMAYAIHTFIGNTCVKAKVNGTMMPLNTELHNGDKVEIITSPHQAPSKEWENFVITGKAKACIKKYIKLKERTEYISLGYSLIKQIFEDINKEFNEKEILEKLLSVFKCSDRNSFYLKIGLGHINFQEVKSVFSTIEKFNLKNVDKKSVQDQYQENNSKTIIVSNCDKKQVIHYAECCSPIPGNEIIGILKRDGGILVHKKCCNNIVLADKDQLVKVTWSNDIDQFFIAKIKIVVINQPGSVAQIASTISSYGINMNDISIPYNTQEFSVLEVALEVNNTEDLAKICAAIRTNIRVKSVEYI